MAEAQPNVQAILAALAGKFIAPFLFLPNIIISLDL